MTCIKQLTAHSGKTVVTGQIRFNHYLQHLHTPALIIDFFKYKLSMLPPYIDIAGIDLFTSNLPYLWSIHVTELSVLGKKYTILVRYQDTVLSIISKKCLEKALSGQICHLIGFGTFMSQRHEPSNMSPKLKATIQRSKGWVEYKLNNKISVKSIMTVQKGP